jgi:uncharacterized membrane protein HdeD (DUF308 family)
VTSNDLINKSSRKTKGLVKAVIGVTLIIFGIVLLFLPGSALVVIPAGLAILATEFAIGKKIIKEGKSGN